MKDRSEWTVVLRNDVEYYDIGGAFVIKSKQDIREEEFRRIAELAEWRCPPGQQKIREQALSIALDHPERVVAALTQ